MKPVVPGCSLIIISALQVAAAGAALDGRLWGAQLQPLLKLWDQLLVLAPPSLTQQLQHNSVSAVVPSASPGGDVTIGGPSGSGPIEAFVALESGLGVSLLRHVGQTMKGLKAAVTGEVPPAAAVQVGRSFVALCGPHQASCGWSNL
jgi:hypothetical protein